MEGEGENYPYNKGRKNKAAHTSIWSTSVVYNEVLIPLSPTITIPPGPALRNFSPQETHHSTSHCATGTG